MTSFTAVQRKELELQCLIFNYVALGLSIPAQLLFLFRRSFSSTRPVPPPKAAPSWIRQRATRIDTKEEEDEEPWRCKRTDGKKWRCPKSKLAASSDYEFKYCGRHLHRGSNMCPRKRVALAPPPPPLPQLSVHPDSTAAFKFPIRFSTEKTAGAFHEQDVARDKQNACPRLEDDKADRHCFVMGVDLRMIKTAEAEEEEEKRYIYLFNKRIEIVWEVLLMVCAPNNDLNMNVETIKSLLCHGSF